MFCIRVVCPTPADEEETKTITRLFQSLMFAIPSLDEPLLMKAIPSKRRHATRLWLVRTTALLGDTGNATLDRIESVQMDRRLGLDGGAMLSVAEVQEEGTDAAYVIWLVEYPEASLARQAHERYRQAINPPRSLLDRNSVIDEPRGRYLAGSWSSEKDFLAYFFGMLEEGLPDVPSGVGDG
jgi:hypothetical protein